MSAMHASDQRLKHLPKSIETVEQVLKDLGTFRPWKPPPKISAISYPEAPPGRIYVLGEAISLAPDRRIPVPPFI